MYIYQTSLLKANSFSYFSYIVKISISIIFNNIKVILKTAKCSITLQINMSEALYFIRERELTTKIFFAC